MHKFHKIGLFSVSAVLALSLCANAAELADPEGGVAAAATASVTVAAKAAPPVKKFAMTRDAIQLDGVAVQPAGYNINDENYFKLRDIALLMNDKQATFSVNYDQSTGSIILTSGEAYQPLGTELKGVSANPKVQPSSAKVILDGKQIGMTAYNIDGNTYFRLRDIGSNLGFEVDYVNRVITLQSGPAATLSVSYDMNGHGEQLAPVAAVKGTKLAAPAAPSASGYTFGGWYRESSCTTPWQFESDQVTSDTTLYAKWVQACTVRYSMNGHGTQVDAVTVPVGSKLSMPTPAPSAAGYIFSGWYKDQSCTEVWDFQTDTVSADTMLYAKWSDTYSVTFHMNGHGTQITGKSNIAPGALLTEPAKPTEAGYTFGGWYIDSACNTPWVFSVDRVMQHVTLYAKWVDNSTGQTVSDPNIDWENNTPTGGNSGTTTPETPVTTTPDHSKAIDGTMTILVDAGHGGTDPGETGNGLDENKVNLAVAQHLRDLLENAGATVIMTRDDTTTTLRGQDRIDAVRALMNTYHFDISISIHHNGANAKAVGAEVYVQTVTQNPGGESKALGEWIIEEYKKLGQSSRGVKTSNLYMTRVPSEGALPAILSEFCFLDTPEDAAKIDTLEEQQAEAQALYNAIMKYFETYGY